MRAAAARRSWSSPAVHAALHAHSGRPRHLRTAAACALRSCTAPSCSAARAFRSSTAPMYGCCMRLPVVHGTVLQLRHAPSGRARRHVQRCMHERVTLGAALGPCKHVSGSTRRRVRPHRAGSARSDAARRPCMHRAGHFRRPPALRARSAAVRGAPCAAAHTLASVLARRATPHSRARRTRTARAAARAMASGGRRLATTRDAAFASAPVRHPAHRLSTRADASSAAVGLSDGCVMTLAP